jgi:hypothetical protein
VVTLAGLGALMFGALLLPLFFGHPIGLLVVGGIAVYVVGFGLLGAFLQRRFSRPRRRARMSVDLAPEERRTVQRAIRRGTPVPPELRDGAIRLARRAAREHRVLQWVVGGWGVLEVAPATGEQGYSRWAGLVFGVILLVPAADLAWFRHRAKQFARRA